jgi:CubicO group peptidase (beta-lactamase class C family)
MNEAWTHEADRIVAEGITTGLQISVIRAGKVLNYATGHDSRGAPIDDESIASFFCVSKAVTAACLARLADDGEISLSATLAEAGIAEGSGFAETTLWELLTHSSGLWGERAERYMGLTEIGAERCIRILRRRTRRRFEGIYGEFAAFHLAGLAAERLTGIPLEQLVSTRVIEPLQLGDQIYFRPELVDRARLRLSGSPSSHGEPIPWLWEATGAAMNGGSSANGCYGTAGGFARLMESIDQVSPDDDQSVAQRCLRLPATRAGRDPVLGRTCRFSLGFLYDMRVHEFPSPVGLDSFGQVGLGGSACAVADPTNCTYLAWRDYTVHEDASDILRIRRRLVGAIYS